MAVLAALASQLRDGAPGAAPRPVAMKPRIVVVRRVYETVIRERVISAASTTSAGNTTVSSSGSSQSGYAQAAAPLTTRTS